MNTSFWLFHGRQPASLETAVQRRWVKHWRETHHSLGSLWKVSDDKLLHKWNTVIEYNSPNSTADSIDDAGAVPISEALKNNSSLKHLMVNSEHKRNRQMVLMCVVYMWMWNKTGNCIRDAGAASMSEMLKTNKTLLELGLGSNHKEWKHTNEDELNTNSFCLWIINRQLVQGSWCIFIWWSIEGEQYAYHSLSG